ncbi:MAG: CAP domain-containing protein [Roseibacillus sp.]
MSAESLLLGIAANRALDAAKPKQRANIKVNLTLFVGALSAVFLASCGGSASDNVATTSSDSTAVPAGNLENETLYHVNRYRTSKGLHLLKPHPGLLKLARIHSNNMEKRDEMGHFDFEKRAKTAQKKYKMGAMSENLHRSWGVVPSGSSIANQWANSPKHKKNMEGNFHYAGMAITQKEDRIYTTLLLGKDLGASTPSSSAAPFLVF